MREKTVIGAIFCIDLKGLYTVNILGLTFNKKSIETFNLARIKLWLTLIKLKRGPNLFFK